jgi:hypothetical protein
MHPSVVDGVPFETSLQAISALEIADTSLELAGSSYQLDMKGQADGLHFGDLIRLQSEALPSRLKRGGKAARLQLDEDEALGHHAAFVYDPASKLLGMEVKMQAAGIIKLTDIVGALAHHPICLGLPLLTTNGLNALAGTKNGTISFKIADPAGLNAIDPELASVRDNMVFLKEMVDGAYINIAIGAGPRREGLEDAKLVRLIGWLLGERDAKRGKVRSLVVSQPHEAETMLDFVNARFSDSKVLNITGDPDADWPIRESLLRTSLAKAKAHVHVNGN